MLHTKPEMVLMAIEAAERHGLDPALVCALVEVSTHWNPAIIEWSASHYGDEEPYSYGLMQVSGKEGLKLTEPKENLETGCKKMVELMRQTNGNLEQTLKLWWKMRDPPKTKLILGMMQSYRKFLEVRPCVNT